MRYLILSEDCSVLDLASEPGEWAQDPGVLVVALADAEAAAYEAHLEEDRKWRDRWRGEWQRKIGAGGASS